MKRILGKTEGEFTVEQPFFVTTAIILKLVRGVF